MHAKFLRTVLPLAVAFSSPVTAMEDDFDSRIESVYTALTVHECLNEETGTNHPHLYNAINAASDEQIHNLFGNAVSRQDLLDVNYNQNLAKHDFDHNHNLGNRDWEMNSSPVTAMEDDFDSRIESVYTALTVHECLNEETGTNHPHLYNAINAASDEQIHNLFGNEVSKQDLLDINYNQNLAKHDFDHNHNLGKHDWKMNFKKELNERPPQEETYGKKQSSYEFNHSYYNKGTNDYRFLHPLSSNSSNTNLDRKCMEHKVIEQHESTSGDGHRILFKKWKGNSNKQYTSVTSGYCTGCKRTVYLSQMFANNGHKFWEYWTPSPGWYNSFEVLGCNQKQSNGLLYQQKEERPHKKELEYKTKQLQEEESYKQQLEEQQKREEEERRRIQLEEQRRRVEEIRKKIERQENINKTEKDVIPKTEELYKEMIKNMVLKRPIVTTLDPLEDL